MKSILLTRVFHIVQDHHGDTTISIKTMERNVRSAENILRYTLECRPRVPRRTHRSSEFSKNVYLSIHRF